MRIGIFGCGQMGANYASILVSKLGVQPSDIVLHDREHAKAQALGQRFGIQTAEYWPDGHIDAAIVAVNTPAHADVLVRLLQNGTKQILCEKPLGMHHRDTARIRKQANGACIYTALVINFSEAISQLRDFLGSIGGEPIELFTTWGKPRPLDKNARPSPGDLEDEAVHPIGVAMSLLPKVPSQISATARVGMLPFVDAQVQEHARKQDKSFPERPNHSTSALLIFHGQPTVPMTLFSSFLHYKQSRTVSGIIGVRGVPVYSFGLEFDERMPDAQGVADMLHLTDLVGKKSSSRMFSNDKLKDLTAAFLKSVLVGNRADPRLADVNQGSALVAVAETILQSSSRGETTRVTV